MNKSSNKIISVITADIIGYSGFTQSQNSKILDAIHDFFDKFKKTVGNIRYTIRRGDNIQIELTRAKDAFLVAILLKSVVNKIIFKKSVKKNRKPFVDIRIAIGVGKNFVRRKTVGESSGDAYIFSGRSLDLMKKKKRIFIIKTSDDWINLELDTECILLEGIMDGWRITSSELIYWKLMGLNDIEISSKIGISRAAISQRKKLASWKSIESLMKRYEELIKKHEK